jgi:hypothetical protein
LAVGFDIVAALCDYLSTKFKGHCAGYWQEGGMWEYGGVRCMDNDTYLALKKPSHLFVPTTNLFLYLLHM